MPLFRSGRWRFIVVFVFIFLGSSADQAGLQPQDCIVKINGQNVSNLDVSRVAGIVKSCDRHILIDVTRLKADVSCVTYNNDACNDMSWDSDSTMTSYDTDSPPSVLAPWKRQTVSPWELYRELKKRQAEAMLDETDTESEYSIRTDECSLSDEITSYSGSYIDGGAPARRGNTPSSLSNASTQTSSATSTSRNVENNPKNQSVKFLKDAVAQSRDLSVRPKVTEKGTRSRSSMGGQSNQSQMSEDSGIEVATQLNISFHVSIKQMSILLIQAWNSTGTVVRWFIYLLNISIYVYISCFLFSQQKLSENEVERQTLFSNVFENEIVFRNDLRQTITCYAHPLQADVVTQEQHQILFQNIDKVRTFVWILAGKRLSKI